MVIRVTDLTKNRTAESNMIRWEPQKILAQSESVTTKPTMASIENTLELLNDYVSEQC